MRTLADLVPLRTAACREAADAVSALAAGEPGAHTGGSSHVEVCLRCQAEVAAFRRVLKVMATMQDEPVAVELFGAGGSRLAGEAGPAWGRRAACIGGVTAAASVYVWWHRH